VERVGRDLTATSLPLSFYNFGSHLKDGEVERLNAFLGRIVSGETGVDRR
jgi:hypothetical protein